MVISRRDDRQIIDVNDRWEALFGYRRADAVGRTMAEAAARRGGGGPGDAPAPGRGARARARRRDPVRHAERRAAGDHRGDRGRGDGRPSLFHRPSATSPSGAARSEAQEQRQLLTHLSRVAVLGELSGALAHELDQPLTAILSNAQAAQRMLAASRSICARSTRSWRTSPAPTGAPARSSGACGRCSGARSNRQLLDLNDIVREVLDLTAVISSRDTSR